MITEQKQWTAKDSWSSISGNGDLKDADLVLAFGSKGALSDSKHFAELKESYPNASIVMNSTSGEIVDEEVWDDSIVSTAMKFEKTKIKTNSIDVADYANSYEAGKAIVKDLVQDDLSHVIVISDGQKVNGSDLTKGIVETLPPEVSCTGGLAGDAANFTETLVGINDAPSSGKVVGIGFYGDSLKVGYASKGGWDSFGVERKVTKSKDNVLYELDGESALSLYKKYLGDQASGLPGSGLLFPLSMQEEEGQEPVVRTLLAIDDDADNMTFAGNIPEGSTVQLMKANFDKIIDAAGEAAEKTAEKSNISDADVAILISCVGRKLILGQRVDEEVEKVRDILGNNTAISGFYSYGEISPFTPSAKCELHNQTMTITTLKEV